MFLWNPKINDFSDGNRDIFFSPKRAYFHLLNIKTSKILYKFGLTIIWSIWIGPTSRQSSAIRLLVRKKKKICLSGRQLI